MASGLRSSLVQFGCSPLHRSESVHNLPHSLITSTATLTPSQNQHADHIWLLARVPPARQQTVHNLVLSAYGFGFAFGQAPALPFVLLVRSFGASVPLRFSTASSLTPSSLRHPLQCAGVKDTHSRASALSSLHRYANPKPGATRRSYLVARALNHAHQQGAGYDPAPDLE